MSMPIVAGWIHVQSPFWWTPFVGLFWGYYPVCVLLYLAWLSKTEIRNLYLSPICHPLGVKIGGPKNGGGIWWMHIWIQKWANSGLKLSPTPRKPAAGHHKPDAVIVSTPGRLRLDNCVLLPSKISPIWDPPQMPSRHHPQVITILMGFFNHP